MNKQVQIVSPRLQTLYGLSELSPQAKTIMAAGAGVAVGVVLFLVIRNMKKRKAA